MQRKPDFQVLTTGIGYSPISITDHHSWSQGGIAFGHIRTANSQPSAPRVGAPLIQMSTRVLEQIVIVTTI